MRVFEDRYLSFELRGVSLWLSRSLAFVVDLSCQITLDPLFRLHYPLSERTDSVSFALACGCRLQLSCCAIDGTASSCMQSAVVMPGNGISFLSFLVFGVG